MQADIVQFANRRKLVRLIKLVGFLLTFLAGLYLLMMIVWPIVMQAYTERTGESAGGLYAIYALIIVGCIVTCAFAFGGKGK
jgi:TRAP-type mannitol/chloroaromatic compound transport system permease small subunit